MREGPKRKRSTNIDEQSSSDHEVLKFATSTRKVCKKYIQPWLMRFLSVIKFVECVYHSSLEHFISNETLRKADIQYVQSDRQNEWHQSMDPNRIYVVGSKASETASTTATMRIPLQYEAMLPAP